MPHSSRCGGHQGERPGIREIFGVFGLLSWILIYITVVALPNVYTKNSHQKGGVAKWPNAFDCKSNLNVVRTFESCLLHKNKGFIPLKYFLDSCNSGKKLVIELSRTLALAQREDSLPFPRSVP